MDHWMNATGMMFFPYLFDNQGQASKPNNQLVTQYYTIHLTNRVNNCLSQQLFHHWIGFGDETLEHSLVEPRGQQLARMATAQKPDICRRKNVLLYIYNIFDAVLTHSCNSLD